MFAITSDYNTRKLHNSGKPFGKNVGTILEKEQKPKTQNADILVTLLRTLDSYIT